MALEDIANTVWNFPPELIAQVSLLISVLQVLGGVIVFYILFSIVNVIINRKRNKKIYEILIAVNNINMNLEEIKNLLRRK
jgi:hypothetical protein|tara:strand:+ start:2686 stop:2928 length:243 start_codon:yes stop_codon:yes gene_type:complete